MTLQLASVGQAQAQLSDHFEEAGTLPGDAPLEIAVDFTQITAQVGRPPTFESPGRISGWGKWTAPSSGAFLMSSTASEDELSSGHGRRDLFAEDECRSIPRTSSNANNGAPLQQDGRTGKADRPRPSCQI